MKKSDKDRKMVRNSLILVLQLGLSMIVPTLLCVGVSYLLAERLGNRNIIIGGIIIGIIAGFNGAYRQVKVYLKDEESPGQRARRLEEETEHDNKVDETPK